MKRFFRRSVCAGVILTLLCATAGCSDQKEIEWVSLSELTADADKALSQTYENLILPESITLDAPAQLVTYQTKKTDLPTDAEQQAALRDLVTEFHGSYDEGNVKLWTDGIEFYYYETDEIYATCDADYASISFSKREYDRVYDLKRKAIYHIDRGESVAGKSYVLNGTDYALTDAVAYADSFVSDKILPLTGYTDARLKTVFVSDAENGNYQYAFEYEYLVEGLPVDAWANTHGEERFMLSPTLLIEMAEPDSFMRIYVDRCFIPDTPDTLTGPFVSLPSALMLAEQFLAKEYTYSVSDIELQYACIAEWGESPTYIYKPYWRLVLQEETWEVGNGCLTPNISLYVDVETGYVCTYDMITGSLDSFPEE